MEPFKSGMFKAIHQNTILNIYTGDMTSRVPNTVSGLIRQVLFLLLHFNFSVYMHSWELGKRLPSYGFDLKM